MRPLSLALLIAIAAPAFAQPDTAQDVENILPETETTQPLESDTETGLWLQLQGSGRVAGSRYTIPGKVATLSYHRYLNSFRYPIPQHYNFKGGGRTSSGSGSSAGSSPGSSR